MARLTKVDKLKDWARAQFDSFKEAANDNDKGKVRGFWGIQLLNVLMIIRAITSVLMTYAVTRTVFGTVVWFLTHKDATELQHYGNATAVIAASMFIGILLVANMVKLLFSILLEHYDATPVKSMAAMSGITKQLAILAGVLVAPNPITQTFLKTSVHLLLTYTIAYVVLSAVRMAIPYMTPKTLFIDEEKTVTTLSRLKYSLVYVEDVETVETVETVEHVDNVDDHSTVSDDVTEHDDLKSAFIDNRTRRYGQVAHEMITLLLDMENPYTPIKDRREHKIRLDNLLMDLVDNEDIVNWTSIYRDSYRTRTELNLDAPYDSLVYDRDAVVDFLYKFNEEYGDSFDEVDLNLLQDRHVMYSKVHEHTVPVIVSEPYAPVAGPEEYMGQELILDGSMDEHDDNIVGPEEYMGQELILDGSMYETDNDVDTVESDEAAESIATDVDVDTDDVTDTEDSDDESDMERDNR